MTPAQFYRIADAKIEWKNKEQKFMDSLNAVQCAVIANAHRGKDTPAFNPDKFRIFPDRKEKSTPEEIAAAMDHMAARQEVKNG
jgi:hypothetical protein